MTRTRYFLARILLNFGLVRRTKRLTDAAYEMHLMQDGEELLGAFCWQEIEGIDDLSHEYWNLRQLNRKKKEVVEKVTRASTLLASAQQRKVDLVNHSKEEGDPFIRKRDEVITDIKSLKEKRDQLMTEALGTKRKHGALKTKLQVLKEEGAGEEEIKKCLEGLANFRDVFIEEKENLGQLAAEISSKEEQLGSAQELVKETTQGSNTEANEAYTIISKANQVITVNQAELSAIEEQQLKLYREVGHFLNLNSDRRDCLKACKKQKVILNQVKLLIESIRRNRRLVDQSRGS